MIEETKVKIVHSVPRTEGTEHIHSTKCKCSPMVSIGEFGQIIVRHRSFYLDFSSKPEFEDSCSN